MDVEDIDIARPEFGEGVAEGEVERFGRVSSVVGCVVSC